MSHDKQIPPPVLFNPLKHHLGFIREYIIDNQKADKQTDKLSIIRDLRHLGGSLMDVYSGLLTPDNLFHEINKFLKANNLTRKEIFNGWAGLGPKEFKTIRLSDDSMWVLKYFNDELRFVHSFPARNSPHSFRVKANTLKSAILYLVFVGKDYVTKVDLNQARAESGLSPIKDVDDTEAIAEMIEILRGE
jgi:hypothetical protein